VGGLDASLRETDGEATDLLDRPADKAWAEIEEAVKRATDYWNDHRHPFIWGRRRRHRQPRRLGIAAVPKLTLI
jgi:hypothetical protein